MKMTEERDREFRFFLKKIGDELYQKDVDAIIYIHNIPKQYVEGKDGPEILNFLYSDGKINWNEQHLLQKILEMIPRKDLIPKLQEFFSKDAIAVCPRKENLSLKKPSYFNSSKDSYEMQARLRGMCLIMSNENFSMTGMAGTTKMANEHALEVDVSEAGAGQNSLVAVESSEDTVTQVREGTKVDENLLETTFKWLGFDVKIFQNCTGSEIKSKLKEVSRQDHSKYNAFVCCILSHGREDGVYGTDWELVNLTCIREMFTSSSCRSLKSKPKLFIIQACRGEKVDPGSLEISPSKGELSKAQHPNPQENYSLDSHPIGGVKGTFSGGVAAADAAHTTRPNDVDFAFAKSSPPGKASVHSKKGSWFIKHFCETLQKYAHKESYLSMQPRIVKAMSNEVAYDEDIGRATGSPDFSQNLSKDWYFRPPCSWRTYIGSIGNKQGP